MTGQCYPDACIEVSLFSAPKAECHAVGCRVVLNWQCHDMIYSVFSYRQVSAHVRAILIILFLVFLIFVFFIILIPFVVFVTLIIVCTCEKAWHISCAWSDNVSLHVKK